MRNWLRAFVVLLAVASLASALGASTAAAITDTYGYDVVSNRALAVSPPARLASSVGLLEFARPAPLDRASSSPTTLVVAAEGLSSETTALAEAHLTDSGTTVLGRFEAGGGYIAKARAMGASYFDIGDIWDVLMPAERTAANDHFLDVIAERGDRVLLSTPKGEIGETGALAHEIAYLTGEKGYVWVNQWSLRPGW